MKVGVGRTSHDILETLRFFTWYGIPELGRAPMYIIDRVEIHVLYMPGECGTPLTEVKVGCIDALVEK